jgi:hypothetical protein
LGDTASAIWRISNWHLSIWDSRLDKAFGDR